MKFKFKVPIWVLVGGGCLRILIGLRDLFAPGFLAPNGRTVNDLQIISDSAFGVFMLAASWMEAHSDSQAIKADRREGL